LLLAGGYSILESLADGGLAGWNPVADDIMAAFRPLADTRKRILEDSELLIRATDAWNKYTGICTGGEIGGFAPSDSGDEYTTNHIPRGYRQLIDLLAWWCDASRFSIDPEPLSELMAWLESAEMSLEFGCEVPDTSEFWVLMRRAVNVINRMRYAASAAKGLEPPKAIKGPGRPVDSKGDKRIAIENALIAGNDPDDVASKFQVTPNYVNKIRRELESEGRLKSPDSGHK
jgi:hypothetical protein